MPTVKQLNALHKRFDPKHGCYEECALPEHTTDFLNEDGLVDVVADADLPTEKPSFLARVAFMITGRRH